MDNDIIIEAKNVSLSANVVSKRHVPKDYKEVFRLAGALKRRHKIPIINDVSLVVRKGERIALTGINGAGKSSLLRLLAGVYIPDQGEVFVRGEVGGLFSSNLGLNQGATGFENIYLRCCMLGIPSAEINREIEEVRQFSRLSVEALERPVKTYSTGMRLRLNTAMTFLKQPRILMMDEWIGAGDKHFRKRILEKMNAVLENVDALIIATHSQRLINELGCRTIELEEGRIVSESSC